MNWQALLQTTGPWLHTLVSSPSDTLNQLWQLERSAPIPTVARIIRGRKGLKVSSFFDECAAALQFPYYFGENWDAYDDCLADLSWLRSQAIILCFSDAHRLLESEPKELPTLLKVLDTVCKLHNQPTKAGSVRKPFHVIFQAEAKDESTLRSRLPA